MEKGKIFYFTVFVLVVFAFIFHVTAMGHHHWKKAQERNETSTSARFSVGLFTRCVTRPVFQGELCTPNRFPKNSTCPYSSCDAPELASDCSCDFLPSTKGIAACAIIASIFLGLAIIILFIHSINTSEPRSIGLVLGLFPLILLLLAFIFILITLILVGSYLSRDMMHVFRIGENPSSTDELRTFVRDNYKVRVDWSTGLEIISLFFTFLSLILYAAYVFKFGRSS